MFQDSKISPAKRGSLKGEYSQLGEKALSLKTGSFAISLPISFPESRGRMAIPFTVSYSPGFGLGEFGIGWSNSLVISRSRDSGVLNYNDDNLITPWGRMVRGHSGFYYSEELAKRVKLEIFGTELVVYLPNGTKVFFGDLENEAYFDRTPSGNVNRWRPRLGIDATGTQTKYSYVQVFKGERPFLKSIDYGGQGEDYQHRIEFLSLEVPYPNLDYSFGKKIKNNRAVKEISVSAKEGTLFQTIFNYEISYLFNDKSPGYYLVGIQKGFSGVYEPQASFHYDSPAGFLDNSLWEVNHDLSELAGRFHTRLTNYYFSNLVDFNNDGRLDMELGQEYQGYLKTDDGFEEIQKIPASGEISTWCLFPMYSARKGRKYQQFLGTNTEQFVYDLFKYGDETILDVCRPNGERVDYFRLPRFWESGPKTIFADINRDGKPDLMHLRGDAYEVIYNTSEGDVISFSDSIEMNPINLPASYSSFWVRDLNGDGEQDLILKSYHSLLVHYGLGDGKFNKDYQQVSFFLPNWVPTSYRLDARNLQFIDVNKDSLPDVLMQFDGFVSLYLNTGDAFLQKYVPGMFAGATYGQNIISGDLSGDGNLELLTTTVGTNLVLSLSLERTEMGLLLGMDDGKGTTVKFSYDKTQPIEGIPNRKTVLTKMERISVGEGTTTFAVSYENPVLHSKTNYLLGFSSVSRIQDLRSSTNNSYYFDQNNRGLELRRESFDLTRPGLKKIVQNFYEETLFDGITDNLLKRRTSGLVDQFGNNHELEETTVYDAAGLCKISNSQSNNGKYLNTTFSYESISAFDQHLSCFESLIRLQGANFEYSLSIERDEQARPLSTTRGGFTQQVASYGENGLISSLWRADKGTNNYYYDENYRLNKVIDEAGVINEISAFDPRNDQPLSVIENRGNRIYEKFFSFDDLGRLYKEWHNLGDYSADFPYKKYSYVFPTDEKLGSIKEIENFEYFPGRSGKKTTFLWQTASGQDLGLAMLGEGAAVLSNVKKIIPQEFVTKEFKVTNWSLGVDFMNISPDQLYSGQMSVKTTELDSIGLSKFTDELVYQNKHMTKDLTPSLAGGFFSESIVENADEGLTVSVQKDAFGHITQIQKEEGNTYLFEHDSLGRLERVTFPGGDEQVISYNPINGLVEGIFRSNIGSIRNEYDLGRNLLSKKQVLDIEGRLERETIYSYDSAGRVTQRQHKSFETNGQLAFTETFHFLYDGQYYNSPANSTQIGFLSAVKGELYEKEMVYAADGALERTDLYVNNELKISRENTYFAQRELFSNSLRLLNIEENSIISELGFSRELNPVHGKLQFMSFNSAPLYNYTYSDYHEVVGVNHNGNFISFNRENNSRKLDSISENGLARVWSFNARGLIESMHINLGDRLKDRVYVYSPNSYLQSMHEEDPDTKNLDLDFGHNSDGLISGVTKNGKFEEHATSSSEWKIGMTLYSLDGLGRVKTRGNSANFIYGATGRIHQAKNNNKILATYYYDEENNPLLKLDEKGDVTVFFEDATFTKDEILLPATLEGLGHPIGFFQNGEFKKVGTDHIGTILLDSKGHLNVGTPYGERTRRKDREHELFDFASKGYDFDIGAIRMGQRYYDPIAKRFLTPDSYFLENYDKILESPVEGNLYSYAVNNPISIIDPKGSMGEAFMSAFVNETYARKEPQRIENTAIEIGKTTAMIGAGAAVATSAIVAAPAVGVFVAKQTAAVGVAAVMNANTALVGAGMYAARNPQVVDNAVGAGASFIQGVTSGYTKTETPPVDGNYMPGSVGLNFFADQLGQFVGKEFSKNYVER